MKKSFVTGRDVWNILGAIVLCAAVGALLTPVIVEASGDRNRQCVENVRALYLPIIQYAQDYDEKLPRAAVWNDPARLKDELVLYTVTNTTMFRCPATKGVPYVTNPAVAGVSTASFDWENTVLFQDGAAHPDGKKTVVFSDGHITRGSIEQFVPSADRECVNRTLGIAQSLQAYAQDYDEQTPFQKDDAGFRAALFPYIRTNRLWNCPETGEPYTISQEIRGRFLGGFPDPQLVEVASDSIPHSGSRVTTMSYLDGHVVQSGPRGVTFPDGTPRPARRPKDVAIQRLKLLGLALFEYAIDHEGTLPSLSDTDALRTALLPYVVESGGTSATFDPPVAGGTPFQLNSALGGKLLASFDSSSTLWIKDVNHYEGRLIIAGYLDGHVGRVAP